MKDTTLTEIMLKSLKEDPSLAEADEWLRAGDYAAEIRFFPHAFKCYQNAFALIKSEETAEKLNTMLDRITNVLELVPTKLKASIEEIRLNNPLDPAKWLAISNTILKQSSDHEDIKAARFSLAFAAYCALRSGAEEINAINEVLLEMLEPVDDQPYEKILSINATDYDQLRVVALGDNITLGLKQDWEVEFRETYHYLWAQEANENIVLANCGISGAGILDAALYLGRDVLSYKPSLALLNYGINDAWLGHEALAAYETLMGSVIELIKPHAEVVIIGPVPHVPENCLESLRPSPVDLKEVQIEAWAQSAKRAAMRANVAYADVLAEFPAEKSSREDYFDNKFNQLNLEGHKLIKKALEKVVVFNA